MIDFLIVINLTVMASVYGYAIATTVVTYPAMMDSERSSAVDFFKPFFHRSAHFQLILSLVVLALSLAISLMSGNWLWAVGALVLQISGPYTIKILMPVNNRVMADGADINSEQMTNDLGAWGRLHLPRTILAAIIFILFAYLAAI